MNFFFIPLSILILLIFNIASLGAESNIPKGFQAGTPQSRGTPSSSVPESEKKNRPAGPNYAAVSIYLYPSRHRIYPSCSLLIENSEELKTGYDPVKELYYNEIPGSVYEELVADNDVQNPLPLDQLPRTRLIDISKPFEEGYTLHVIGTETGTYGLDIKVWDSDLNFSQKKFRKIPIILGETHTYSFYYSKTGGDDVEVGFDSSGQSPRDANKFIGYVRPSQKRTTLPIGTTTYNAIVVYGDSIIPSSFKAELNGLDITSLFNPVQEGTDAVTLNLNQGSNKLILSVDANLTNGVANNKDTLLFMVP